MPLSFSTVCKLLQQLEDIAAHDPPLLPADRKRQLRHVIDIWFHSRRSSLDSLSPHQATALLSCLLPELRTDRVYNVQTRTLCRILCRGLSLGTARRSDLEAYRLPGRGDLGQCLERVMRDGYHDGVVRHRNTAGPSLDDIDALLQSWAAQCRFSDTSVIANGKFSSTNDRHHALSAILSQIHPGEAKWLTRLILKDLAFLKLEHDHIFGTFHFLLPNLLKFQQHLHACMEILRGSLKHIPSCPDRRSHEEWIVRASELLRPSIGVKVGRPTFYKARSIQHCIKMLGRKEWVLERKVDGEYCEVHVSKGKDPATPDRIRIFSKSGKDSTCDRQALLEVLRLALRLDEPDCQIKDCAIILGELVIVSTENNRHKVLPFETIRKHIQRCGTYIGTAEVPTSPHEFVGIVLFDLLLIDADMIMQKCIKQRRKRLRQIYQKVPGRVMSSEWKAVDFGQPESEDRLVQHFAAAITDRCEGLILKPCGVPYLSLGPASHSWQRSYIKLKKDYIAGLGDEIDIVIVGASHDSQHAMRRVSRRPTEWTSFHMACLNNKSDILSFGATPQYRLLEGIHHEECIPAKCLETLNDIGRFRAKPYGRDVQPAEFEFYSLQGLQMDVYFTEPIVVEVLGSGYVKPPNCDYFMLRHARLVKVHEDRTWRDTDSFTEIQSKAQEARRVPESCGEIEQTRWVQRLVQKTQQRQFRQSLDGSRSKSIDALEPEQPVTCEVVSPSDHSEYSKRLASWQTPVPTGRLGKRRRTLGDLSSNQVMQPRNTKDITSGKSNELCQPLHHSAKSDGSLAPLCPPLGQKSTSSQVHQCHEYHSNSALPRLKMQASYDCCNNGCLFFNSVVYLSQCVAGILWITEDLLPAHQCVVIADLAFWLRNNSTHASQDSIVQESQSYVGLRKLVLAERNRQAQISQTIKQIMSLRVDSSEECIEVYDWRVLTLLHGSPISPKKCLQYRIATCPVAPGDNGHDFRTVDNIISDI